MSLLINPILLGVTLMLILCAFRFNIFLAIVFSAVFTGFLSFEGDIITRLKSVMDVFINGMSGNLEISLSYLFVGAIANAVGRTNLSIFFVQIIAKYLSKKRFILLLCIAFFSCFSQNLIPIHIAFIPILIPPLLPLFNKLKIDRRAVAAAVSFGITTPYMTLPLGFGLIFQNVILDSLKKSGLEVNLIQISQSSLWMLPIMLFGLLASIIYFKKPREYEQKKAEFKKFDDFSNIPFTKKEGLVLIGLIITLLIQIFLSSLPLAGLAGFLFMCLSGAVPYKQINEVFSGGFELMGFIAFIMLVAAGFGNVLIHTNSIEEIVNFVLLITKNRVLIAFFLLCVGLLITLGIGSSFGTISLITPIFAPICIAAGFSTSAVIFIIACAAAVGDTGSPASETTLGINVGLNADGQNSHIKDVCIPTFIFYNIPLVVFGTIVAVFL